MADEQLQSLPPVPYKAEIAAKSGFLMTRWANWFRELYNLVTGNDARLEQTENQVAGLNQGPNL